MANKAERQPSHMLSTGSRMALGKIVQSHAAPAASDLPPSRRPTKYKGMMAATPQLILKVTTASQA